MMALRLPQPAQIRLRRGGVAAARRTVSIRPVRATAAPGGAKGGGDPQFRRRATPRAEPFTSSQDPLTEAATKATSRLAKGLNEQSRPPVSPTPAPKEDAEWEAWLEYFESCDRAMFMIDALQLQQDDAVKSERFGEAAAVRMAIAAIEDKDSVQGLMRALDEAIKSERFAEAAKLRDLGAGLVGWWAGRHEPRDPTEEADPHGCILRVTPAPGRFLGSMYAVRDLVGSQGGVPDLEAGYPVLELFVQRDASTGKEQFKLQPVAVYGASTDMDLADSVEDALSLASMGGPEVNVEIVMQTLAAAGVTESDDEFESPVDDELEDDMPPGVADLGDTISSLLLQKPESDEVTFPTVDFLDEEMMAEEDVVRVPATLTRLGRDAFVFEHVPPEIDDEQPEDEEGSGDGEGEGDGEALEEEDWDGKVYTVRDAIADAQRGGAAPSASSGDDWSSLGGRPAQAGPESVSGRGGALTGADDRGLDIEVGAGFFDKWDSVAAEIDKLDAAKDPKARQALIKAVREAAESIIASHGLPADTKVVISTDGTSPGGPDMGSLRPEMALSQRMRFDRLREGSPLDPFSQLFVGNFGPHGPEVIQMQRGTWGEERGFPDDHVSAFKVTADENVPVGRTTFRAKVGRQHRLNPAEVYPEELGVIARYPGEGRVAKPGFQGAYWADGELLLLDGQRSITGGAEMGFVWSIPNERRFLILFSQLRLPADDDE